MPWTLLAAGMPARCAPRGKDRMERPVILLFSALYPPHAGGVETYVQSLARTLVHAGLRAVVVTMAVEAPAGISQEDGVDVVRLPCRELLGGRYPIPRLNAESHACWDWLSRLQPRGIVVNARFYLLSREGLRFAQKQGVRPVLIEHGSAHLTMGSSLLDTAVQAVEHALSAQCRRFPVDCYAVSAKASAWLGHFGMESLGELTNAIDADAFCASASERDFRTELGLDNSELMVAFVGRLVREKGVENLAQACREARHAGRHITVVAAGGGPLKDALSAFDADGFRCVGGLSRPDVAALLSQADVLFLPSRSEGFATAFLEAAACGTPFVATDVGGARELAPDESYSTILPDAAPETLAAALAQADDDRNRLAGQGARLAQRVREQCAWDVTARRVITACERANAHSATMR